MQIYISPEHATSLDRVPLKDNMYACKIWLRRKTCCDEEVGGEGERRRVWREIFQSLSIMNEQMSVLLFYSL